MSEKERRKEREECARMIEGMSLEDARELAEVYRITLRLLKDIESSEDEKQPLQPDRINVSVRRGRVADVLGWF